MDESSLTIAILREIRDNTARTNERVDHLTERVDHLSERVDHLTDRVDVHGELLQTMAAVQIRQEALLQRHDDALCTIIVELRRVHDRIDHVYEGPLTGTLRDHESRLRRLEGRE
ncbi:MAG: hypothetical protein R3A48_27750 [Polyangiales bacterium]